MTTPEQGRERFRQLPVPVLLEDTVESVETTQHPLPDADEERDRFLRQAAG